MYAVSISDLHLGSDLCLADSLIDFLEGLPEVTTLREVVINGDLFDSRDLRRLTKKHWKVLSLLRRYSDTTQVTWVAGNHDGPLQEMSALLGVQVYDEYVLHPPGGTPILFLHGHQYDRFLDDHPLLTIVGDTVYNWLQKLDRSHKWARAAKRTSKDFQRCAERIRRYALKRAEEIGASAVCCGHTHHADAFVSEGGLGYYNSGSWCERPSSYLEISETGKVEVKHYYGS